MTNPARLGAHALGHLLLPEPPATFVPSRLARDGILPPGHRAQAQLEEMTLVTADRALQAYDVPLVLA